MKLDLAWVRARLPEREIHWFDSIPTTMEEASRLAGAGCPSGTVVGAEEQTSGVGRYGRNWHSEPGSGLYQSIVLRLPIPVETFPAVTLAVGLGVREAIFETTDVECDLRWPNDLLAGEKKCAGILVQVEGSAVIAGVGINVNHDAFPAELAGIATSLRLASGRIHGRESLLAAILRRIDHWTAQPAVQVLEGFTRISSYAAGKRVEAEGGVRGTTAGLDAHGYLLLRKDNGEVVRILAGGVRPCS